MLVLDMIYVDWIVKKKKNLQVLWDVRLSHDLDPWGFGAWQHLYKLIKIGYRDTLDCYNILSFFFRTPFHGGSLTLYIFFLIILILHLSIIWAFTWVLVPSDTLPSFLWVVVTKATLFRGLLHINVARKVAALHSMQW